MPPAPSIAVEAVVDASYSFKATWDIDTTLAARRIYLKKHFNVEGGPPGEVWLLQVRRKLRDLDISFTYVGDELNMAQSRSARGRLVLFWLDDQRRAHEFFTETFADIVPKPSSVPSVSDSSDTDSSDTNSSDIDSSDTDSFEPITLWGERFTVQPQGWRTAADKSGGSFVPSSHRAYRLSLELGCTYKPSKKLAESLAERLSGLHLERIAHDVCLFFPHARKDGAELWAKGDFLSRSSSYLKDLLASDFAESVSRSSKRRRTTSFAPSAVHSPDEDEQGFGDSDTETDRYYFFEHPTQTEQSAEVDLPYRQITVTQTAYSTYHAILVYLLTDYVCFTPLTSSFSGTATSTSAKLRRDWIIQHRKGHPDLPLPVSPTSAYRLAHLLQLSNLEKRSLDAFASFLTADNAAYELFSDTSVAYDELRAVVVGFVQENWYEVKASEGWKAMREHIQSGEAPATFLPVLLEVLEKVA